MAPSIIRTTLGFWRSSDIEAQSPAAQAPISGPYATLSSARTSWSSNVRVPVPAHVVAPRTTPMMTPGILAFALDDFFGVSPVPSTSTAAPSPPRGMLSNQHDDHLVPSMVSALPPPYANSYSSPPTHPSMSLQSRFSDDDDDDTIRSQIDELPTYADLERQAAAQHSVEPPTLAEYFFKFGFC